MRVLIAPDKFAGTLSAVEAADAIAEGWRRRAPHDDLDLAPMADGGPGFVDVLHAALGGNLLATTVPDPYAAPVPATVLLTDRTAYVECAQAVGLHLTRPEHRRPERASSRGVGELMLAAAQAGASRVVVGVGGTAVNDGGAGLLAALGATADRPLDAGPEALAGLATADVGPARRALADLELVLASDVDNPLLGLTGATNVYGAQKGLAEDRRYAVEGWLEGLAAAVTAADPGHRRTARAAGAGAGGGLGFALLLLGATRLPGLDCVAQAVRLSERAAAADLVLTGEGAFDFSSRSGKVPYGVAQVATAAIRPCVALAGQVLVGSREMRALGIESAYSMVDLVGEERAMGDPRASLAALAERVARTWSE